MKMGLGTTSPPTTEKYRPNRIDVLIDLEKSLGRELTYEESLDYFRMWGI